jgi:uncharacterized Tic20 family protein
MQETNKDARMWGMLCHLISLSGYITGLGYILGPLIIWLIKKEEFPFVDDQGKESLNFQLTILILAIAASVLTVITCGVGGILLAAIGIVQIIFVILASVAANNGEYYRYPFNFRFIK